MRSLLLSLIILFALVILPVGAQNETEIVSDDSAISPSDQSLDQSSDQLSSDAASADPLTQIVFDGNSETDYLYSLPVESTPSDQPDDNGKISEEPINNLENLENSISSSGPGGSENSPQDDGADEGPVIEADSGEAFSEEDLKMTMQAIDQSEAGFPIAKDEGASPTNQVSSKDTDSMLNIFGQQDGNLIQNDVSPEGNLNANSDMENIKSMRSVLGEGSGKTAIISNRAGTPAIKFGSESPGNGDEVIRDQYSRSLSNLARIMKLAEDKDATNENLGEVLLGMNSRFDVLQNPDPEKADYLTILPYWGPLAAPSNSIRIETSHIADLSINDEGDKPKNYAVVVGINQYSYSGRRSLHTSVNDAEEMARVLREFYGYEVILLTDKTKDLPPTKHNILDGALAEVKTKKNRGDVLVYFSGHGEVDDKGIFYLIPKDAKTTSDSYISEDDLNRYTKDIKGLSLIVDACYSGGLYSEDQKLYSDQQGVGTDQLIMRSSRKDEPSNEMWNETNSVFTYYLCHAMQDEAKKNGGLPLQTSLQSCFESVKDNTVSWSNSHFLGQSQTPNLTLA